MAFTRKLALLSGFFALLAALFIFVGFGSASRPGSAAVVQSSPSLSFDGKILLKQFQEAQDREMKGLLSHEKAAARHLKSAQAAQQKEFDHQEKTARRKFFAADTPGPEKRAYMKDLLSRRAALRQQMSTARAVAKQQSDERVQALRDEQLLKLQKFQNAINQGQRPDDSLWPQPTLETD